jgi:hypothetical protein
MYVYLSFGTQELDTHRSEIGGHGRSVITIHVMPVRLLESWGDWGLVKADVKRLGLIQMGCTIHAYVQWIVP